MTVGQPYPATRASWQRGFRLRQRQILFRCGGIPKEGHASVRVSWRPLFGMANGSLMHLFTWRYVVLIALFIALFFAAMGSQAQDVDISDNAVNEIAEKMYCPVCENIPLDECHTLACIEWKEEIRQQLGDGRGEQAIIDSFVRRFGDHVVGVPVDPILRSLTIIMPMMSALLAIGLGIFTFRRFSSHQKLQPANSVPAKGDGSDEAYRQRLEEDLLARR